MDALEAVRRQAYADGLFGKTPPRTIWLGTDEFCVAYQESWLAGSLAATAPAPAQTLSQGSVSAFFRG